MKPHIPHIKLINGYWRVVGRVASTHPVYRSYQQQLAMVKAIKWCRLQNEAREFGMVVPGTT